MRRVLGIGAVAIALGSGFVGVQAAAAAPAPKPVAPPVVRGFAPTTGLPGTVVVVNGKSFASATGVTVGGLDSAFSAVDDRRLLVTVPLAAPAGSAPVVVTGPGGSSSIATPFVVTTRIVRGFFPRVGAPGTTVVVTGFGFTGATGVAFGDVAAELFSVDSDRQLSVVVPVGARKGPIAVTVGGATGDSGASVFDPETAVRGFYPRTAVTGTPVVISGRNFDGATEVWFGDGQAVDVSVDSSTQITAVVPADATTGPVTVVAPGGTSTAIPWVFLPRFPLVVETGGDGTVSCGSAGCGSDYPDGASLTLTAIQAGASPAYWDDDCAHATGRTCTVTFSSAVSVVAVFGAVLTVQVDGDGTVLSADDAIECVDDGDGTGNTCSSPYLPRDTVVLSAVDAPADALVEWTGCDTVDEAGDCTVTLMASRTVSAVIAVPHAAFDPAAGLDFGDVPVGESGAPVTVWLVNDGEISVELDDIVADDPGILVEGLLDADGNPVVGIAGLRLLQHRQRTAAGFCPKGYRPNPSGAGCTKIKIKVKQRKKGKKKPHARHRPYAKGKGKGKTSLHYAGGAHSSIRGAVDGTRHPMAPGAQCRKGARLAKGERCRVNVTPHPKFSGRIDTTVRAQLRSLPAVLPVSANGV